jgi:glycosyltransferase involved in cell wall biosynthesis
MSKGLILYIGGFELPDKNASAHRVTTVGKIFKTLGYDVAFLGVNRNMEEMGGVAKVKYDSVGFDVWERPYPKNMMGFFSFLFSAKQVRKVIRKYSREGVKAVVAYNYPAVAQLFLQIYCRRNGVTFLSDSTEWYESSGGTMLFNLVKGVDTFLRMRFSNKLSDGLITTSPYLTSYYSSVGVPIVQLPTMYDKKNLADIVESVEYKPKRNEKLNLIYAGNPFTTVKRAASNKSNIKDRLDQVVEFVYRLHCNNIPVCLNVYGVDEKEYLSVFVDDVSKLESLDGAIVFHGRRPHREIMIETRKSDFSIFFREPVRFVLAGLPGKYTESISCGTPVITNYLRLENIKEYVRPNENTFLVKNDGLDFDSESIESISCVTAEDLSRVSSLCQNSCQFDYREYCRAVELFFRKLEL